MLNLNEVVAIQFVSRNGAGKGSMIAKLLNLFEERGATSDVVSTGAIFRGEWPAGVTAGLKSTAASYMQRGELAPADITMEVVKLRLRQVAVASQSPQFLIFDGVPRDYTQLITLFNMLTLLGVPKIITVELRIDEMEATRRMQNRLVCPDQHITSRDKAPDGKCPVCNKPLRVRTDDGSIVTIKKRLKEYQHDTAAMLEYFHTFVSATGYDEILPYVLVDARPAIEHVFADLQRRLLPHLNLA